MFDRWPELGPATIRIDELEGVPSMQVEVDRDASRAATALRWIDGPLDAVDATLGTFDRQSVEWWLHVRGWMNAEQFGVVSIPYNEHTDEVELALIREQIEGQDVRGILSALAWLEVA